MSSTNINNNNNNTTNRSATTSRDTGTDYERVLLVKPTVYVYRIPPLTSGSRGFRASDWNLGEPDWTGRLRLISRGEKCFIRIEDSTTGNLYCQAPVDEFPGPQVQPVVDSRRYFVVKVVSDSGRTALIGVGFSDGADSFDLSVALQDHFTGLQNATKLEESELDRPKLDLSLKGDIKVNLKIGGLSRSTAEKSSSSRTRGETTALRDPSKPFFLPPPPSSRNR